MINATEVETKTFELERKEHVNLATIAYETAKSIRDADSFQCATDLLLKIKTRRNRWKEFIDPLVRSAKEAHNKALAKRREVEEPLRQAEEDILKPAIEKWIAKQEDIRRAQEVEMKNQTGFDIVLPTVTKKEGISYRTTWSAEVVDMKLFVDAIVCGRIPIEAVIPNMPMLNNMAKTFKTGLGWPGVQVKSEKSVSARPNMEAL
jgi:hypothetical protein